MSPIYIFSSSPFAFRFYEFKWNRRGAKVIIRGTLILKDFLATSKINLHQGALLLSWSTKACLHFDLFQSSLQKLLAFKIKSSLSQPLADLSQNTRASNNNGQREEDRERHQVQLGVPLLH